MQYSSRASSDSGAQALVTIAQYHQVAADLSQLRHQFSKPGDVFGDTELLRAAKAIGFKARLVLLSFGELSNAVLPAIAKSHDGKYFVLARVAANQSEKDSTEGSETQGKALIIHSGEHTPQEISESELSQQWPGELILMTRRGGLLDAVREFDISWFIPSMIKYRKLFGDVILASFFLQLFALITPLFFQVVMDKVLVHKGLTTLYVLAFGFLVVAVFDAILGGIRTYVFSHTTNRVDVELGSKLFNHLMRLPLAYFEARQVGQSVARVLIMGKGSYPCVVDVELAQVFLSKNERRMEHCDFVD